MHLKIPSESQANTFQNFIYFYWLALNNQSVTFHKKLAI
ncbi:hypothetical protein D020_3057 [Vibrio parahaemolyticus SBR10290]|nr:hypothetical protein D024_0962 [Vibrio parahaemolyticus 3259]ESV68661.1 hypothetical protein D021_2217 [Vibrio parahaemolyticus 10296]ESW44204.1 hypothetical protein D022_2166 [Vibrio parahaemolyticus 12310]ETJ87814.1 hypothetical protein D029_3014 [Vibrio parahaemolyticus 970107]ETJ90304.1 hypothetical protein D041_3015 [Vibrio parahaemolyticus EKP-008]ETT20762.1 hypothetical protein D023_2461 [Vibrio parahaemolyticus 3256]ETX53426.1 hypothetical protein D020_3057 [Vibrio parahaemolyticus